MKNTLKNWKQKLLIMNLFCAIIAFLFSCKTHTKIAEVPVNNQTTIIEKLVPVPIAPDSVLLTALFECDSLYNVVLKGFTEQKSNGMESGFNFSGGTLDYQTRTKSDTVFIPGKEVFIEKEIPVQVPVEVEVNKLTGRQKFFIKTGQIACGLLILIMFYMVIKWYLKLKK